MRGFADFYYYIRSVFNPVGSSFSTCRHNHDFNGYSVIAKVLNGKMYVPVFMYKDVVELISNEGYIRNSDIIYDIPAVFSIVKAATTSRILKFFLSNRRRSNFTNVITGKGYEYKGTNGVILDGDYNPLMLLCNIYDIIGDGIECCEPACFISPRVFNNTDLISKFIVKNLIPNICNVTISTFHPNVIITNSIDDFINKPKCPVGSDFNESIYRTLEDHIDEIVDEPQGILQGLDQSNTL